MPKQETQVETITMLNGTKVDFTGKTRLKKTVIISPEGVVTLQMDFRNGESRTFVVPASLMPVSAGHGVSQKFGDSIASVDDIEDAVETIDQLMDRLAKGDWNSASEGGSGMSGASVLAKALVEVTGQPITVVRAYLGGLDNKTKAALRLSPEVAPVVKRLEAEKAARAAAKGKTAAASVDTASILANLAAGGVPANPASALPEAGPALV